MATHTKYTVLLAGLVLTVVCCLRKRQVAAPPRLSVTFTGLWNNPRAEPKGFRIQPNGDRGLCAVFAVTNISKEPAIWFDIAFVEQKTEAGWIRVQPESWEAIDSSYMNSWWDSKMKQHASIGTWIVALAVSGCAGINSTSKEPAMNGQSEDIKAIKQLATDWRSGWLAGDADALLSLYADEPVLMPQDQPAVVGKDAIRPLYESVLREYEIKSEGKFMEVEASGDLGYFWSTYTLTATPKAGGDPIKSAGKSVSIVKRQPGGAWKIVRLIDNSDGIPP